MRSILIALLGFTLLLAGCSGGTVTPESVKAEIQKDCGIVVTVADIAALITANPTAAGVAAFAKMVCDAFAVQKSSRRELPRTGVLDINGVPVHYTVQ